jgi:hypothetical protein
MSKKTWIKIGIGTAVVLAVVAMIKIVPFYGTLLSLCSYAAGIASYWAIDKFGKEVVNKEK